MLYESVYQHYRGIIVVLVENGQKMTTLSLRAILLFMTIISEKMNRTAKFVMVRRYMNTLVHGGVHGKLNDYEVSRSSGCKTSTEKSPSCLTGAMWFVLIRRIWFSTNVLLCRTANYLHFGLIFPRKIISAVLSFVQM